MSYTTEHQLPCPYCQRNAAETSATAPYVRGFLVAYQIGSKTFCGCANCVRTQLLKEAGTSALIGWFSITALVINPFLIMYNLGRAPFIKPNKQALDKTLRQAGISTDGVDVPKVATALAASMIAADGEIEPEEIQCAVEIGQNLIEDFDPDALIASLENINNLPEAADLGRLLRNALPVEGKALMVKYLYAIAASDGHVDDSEVEELAAVAEAMGVDLRKVLASMQEEAQA